MWSAGGLGKSQLCLPRDLFKEDSDCKNDCWVAWRSLKPRLTLGPGKHGQAFPIE